MGKLIFITGGVRSGKSSFAVELAKQLGRKVAFVATCIPQDDEMRSRVEEHKKRRPPDWRTVEEATQIASSLQGLRDAYQVVIVDCLTLFVSNLLLAGNSEKEITNQAQAAVESVLTSSLTAIVVSNEVGSGIVPNTELGRKFRDIAGVVNQMVANQADEVYLMVSGVSVKIKGEQQ